MAVCPCPGKSRYRVPWLCSSGQSYIPMGIFIQGSPSSGQALPPKAAHLPSNSSSSESFSGKSSSQGPGSFSMPFSRATSRR